MYWAITKKKINLKKKMNVLHVITSRMQNEKYFREEVKKQVPSVIDCIELSMYDKLHITNTLHMMKWWISNSNRTFFNTCQKYKKEDNIYTDYAPSHRYICMTWTYHCMNIVEWHSCFLYNTTRTIYSWQSYTMYRD